MTVKRYTPTQCCEHDGTYVTYSDYQKLVAESEVMKSVINVCQAYFIAGIRNTIRPSNEGYLHMRRDTVNDETPNADAFTAELRAQGADTVAEYHKVRVDSLIDVDRKGANEHKVAYMAARDVVANLRAGRK